MEKQNYHHEDLKSELIQKGLFILNAEGYEDFSLRKVAKACNVSQAAPYRHFKNKDELIMAIFLEATQAFNQSLENAALKYQNNPKMQLKEMGICYIRFFYENPEYLHLIFSNNMFINMNNFDTNKNSQDICSPEGHLKSGHPFATFYNAIKNFAVTSTDNSIEQEELMLYCWGLVHGISVLLSNNKIPLQGDFLKLAERIIYNDTFLS